MTPAIWSALFLLAFGGLAVLAARRPLLARLAWREAIRRRGQSALLVAGLPVGAAMILCSEIWGDSLITALVHATVLLVVFGPALQASRRAPAQAPRLVE